MTTKPDPQFQTRTLVRAAARKMVLTPTEITDHDQLLIVLGGVFEVVEDTQRVVHRRAGNGDLRSKVKNNAGPFLGGGGVLLILREIAGYLAG